MNHFTFAILVPNLIRDFFMKYFWVALFFCFFGNAVNAQFETKTNETEIYILTCSPGADLYSVFGHTAIMVKTPTTDFVYNYGTFDFNTDNFYVKFARGQLPYKVAKEEFGYFQYGYIREQRQIWAQRLNFTSKQKTTLIDLLEVNVLPENALYKYDFFYDNCATRIRDIIDEATGNTVDWGKANKANGSTFRQMIDVYLPDMEWSDLGIDIALGLPCDYYVQDGEQAFLPDSLMYLFDNARLNGNSLMADGFEVLPAEPIQVKKKFKDSSFKVICFISIVLLIVLFIYRRKRFSRILSALILLVNGLVGTLIFLLWFFTDHNATMDNLNILWASPLNLILPFLKFSRKIWLQIYSGITVATLMVWSFLPQDMHESLVPFVFVSLFSALIYIRRIDE